MQLVDVLGHQGVEDGPLPQKLLAAQPNPFTSGTQIRFATNRPGLVSVDVFDLQGRRVAGMQEHRPQGEQVWNWNGASLDGSTVAAGVYFYRFRAGGVTLTRKLVRVN